MRKRRGDICFIINLFFSLYKDKKTEAEVVRMKSLLDGFTKEEKIRFIYIDVLSRNLADEEIIEKEMQKELIDKGIRQM